MAIGVLGMPLLKGKSQEITTAFLLGANDFANKAGRAVFADGSVIDDMETCQGAETAQYAGVLSTDYMKDKTGDNYVVGLLKRGRKVPVQIPTGVDPELGNLAITATGLFTNASDEDAVILVDGEWHDLGTYEGINQDGKEIRCALVNLNGGQNIVIAPAAQAVTTLTAAQKKAAAAAEK